MLNIILFGPPGSGKGTQSEKLLATYGLKHLSTGDLLRKEMAEGTAIGLEAKKLIDQGQLAPDQMVIDLIEDALKNNPEAKGFLLDGFPRTKAQAIAYDNLLKQNGTEVTLFLSLQVSEEELEKRLLNRGRSSGRSDDLNEGVIHARIVEYHSKTAIVEDYYEQYGKTIKINGEGNVEEIFQSLCKEIDKKIHHVQSV